MGNAKNKVPRDLNEGGIKLRHQQQAAFDNNSPENVRERRHFFWKKISPYVKLQHWLDDFDYKSKSFFVKFAHLLAPIEERNEFMSRGPRESDMHSCYSDILLEFQLRSPHLLNPIVP